MLFGSNSVHRNNVQIIGERFAVFSVIRQATPESAILMNCSLPVTSHSRKGTEMSAKHVIKDHCVRCEQMRHTP
jgi:hypothetical protein